MDNLREKAVEILRKKYLIGPKEDGFTSRSMTNAMLEFLIAVQPEELERLSKVENELLKTVSELEKRVRELETNLRHTQNNFNGVMQEIGEKEILASAFDKVQRIFAGREWITEGRGPYAYDDEEYKMEVRYLLDDFKSIKDEVWSNIRTNTFAYKRKIIEQYEGNLKDDYEYFFDIVKQYQGLCLMEHPDIKDIVALARDVKNGQPFPIETRLTRI